jgi:glyoxylase-like metal-dependent hydrolase (beta-lactamase superfamily II)
VRVRLGSAGGVPGAVGDAWLVGRRRVVVVDPGDPTDAGLAGILEACSADGLEPVAVVVTSAGPERAGGAVGLALVLGVPLFAARHAAALVGDPCTALDDRAVVDAGDVPLRVVVVPGPAGGGLEVERGRTGAAGVVRLPVAG